MITPSANAAIVGLFKNSIRDHSLLADDDNCSVDLRDGAPSPVAGGRRQVVVLNIVSYLFRIVAVFDFEITEAAISHLAKASHNADGGVAGQAFFDASAEFVNLICGTVNRGLSAQFRHSGMSTPFVLEGTCASHLSILNPSDIKWLDVAINDAMRFCATVCICVADGTTLDFDISQSESTDASAGELELF